MDCSVQIHPKFIGPKPLEKTEKHETKCNSYVAPIADIVYPNTQYHNIFNYKIIFAVCLLSVPWTNAPTMAPLIRVILIIWQSYSLLITVYNL